jgi:hypothetical protein
MQVIDKMARTEQLVKREDIRNVAIIATP